MIDDLPKMITPGESGIVNTDIQSGDGKHWVCYYNGDHDYVEYFDPYGVIPDPRLSRYLQSGGKQIYYNNSQIQRLGSNLCGYYCGYYINRRDAGVEPYDILYEFEQMPSDFNEDRMKGIAHEIVGHLRDPSVSGGTISDDWIAGIIGLALTAAGLGGKLVYDKVKNKSGSGVSGSFDPLAIILTAILAGIAGKAIHSKVTGQGLFDGDLIAQLAYRLAKQKAGRGQPLFNGDVIAPLLFRLAREKAGRGDPSFGGDLIAQLAYRLAKQKAGRGIGNIADFAKNFSVNNLLGSELGKNIPELHLFDAGYDGKVRKDSFAGPFTKLDRRVEFDGKPPNARVTKVITAPNNDLDRAALSHDVAYYNNRDLANRHRADQALLQAADQIASTDSNLIRKGNANLVKRIMESKIKNNW